MAYNHKLLDSLLAQRRLYVGPHGNGDHPHSRKCKRCARGSRVTQARGHHPDALA